MRKRNISDVLQRLKPAKKSGKFKSYQNEKGEWCIGNDCFRIRAGKDELHISFNPDPKGNCPKDTGAALRELRRLARDGKGTRMSLPVEEKW